MSTYVISATDGTALALVTVAAIGAPSGLTVSSTTDKTAALSWTSNSDGSEDGFAVERSAHDPAGAFAQVGTTGSGQTTFTDNGPLTAATEYDYRARAFVGALFSAYSNIVTATTQTNASPPDAPTLDSLAAPNSSEITGSFTAAATGSAATGFKVFVGTSSPPAMLSQTLSAGASALDLTGQSANTLYYVGVKATNTTGDSALSNIRSITTPASSGGTPPAPTPTSAVAASDTVFSAMWFHDPTALSYKLQTSPDNVTYTTVKTAPANWTRALIGGQTGGSTVYFRVVPVGPGGDGTPSTGVSCTMLASGHVASPTGRNPHAIWSPQLQNDMASAASAGAWNPGGGIHPTYQRLLNYVATPSTAPYSGKGLWEAALYQATGNAAYAASAWTQMSAYMVTLPPGAGINPDDVKELIALFAIAYDWLYPWLSANGHVADAYGLLNNWCSWCLGTFTAKNGGFNTSDTDQCSGQYVGLALVDLLSAPDNPLAGTWTAASSVYGNKIPVGGLDYTAADRTTVRNAIHLYCTTYAKGGAWFESSDYNLNTKKFLALGAEAVRTATDWNTVTNGGTSGVEHFPEVLDLCMNYFPLQKVYEATPDFGGFAQWGDTEVPHSAYCGKVTKMPTDLFVLQAIARNSTSGGYLSQLISNAATVYPWGGTWPTIAECDRAAYFCWAPYVPAVDYTAAGLNRSLYCAGPGQVYYHDAWTGSSSLFFHLAMPEFATASSGAINHNETVGAGHFQVYRNGAWSITNPIGYKYYPDTRAQSNGLLSARGMLLAGCYTMRGGTRGILALENDQAGLKYQYVCSGTAGSLYNAQYAGSKGASKPPPSFCNEWTRSVFYLPSSDQHSDVVVVIDRTNLINPKNQSITYAGTTYTGTTLYNANDAATINAAPALATYQDWFQSNAVISGSSISDAIGSQTSRLDILAPAGVTLSLAAGSTIITTGSFVSAETSRLVGRGVPSTAWPTGTTAQQLVWVSVRSAFDTGTTVTSTLVQSTDSGATAQGALVSRSTGGVFLHDTLCLGSATFPTRILSAGYTVTFTPATSNVDVLLSDLDPSKTWTVKVNGGAPQAVTVSDCSVTAYNNPTSPASGVGKIALSGLSVGVSNSIQLIGV